MKKLLVGLLLLTCCAGASTCPGTSWYQTSGLHAVPNVPFDSAWNKVKSDLGDGGYFYTFAAYNANLTTFQNTFYRYTVQCAPETNSSNPWTLLGTSGTVNANSNDNVQPMWLQTAIGSTDTTIPVQVNNNGVTAAVMPVPGTITVDLGTATEEIDYTSCTSNLSSTSCPKGSSTLKFGNATRGVRQGAGNSAPIAHAAGATVWLAAPMNNPPSSGWVLGATNDFPPDRHITGDFVYDPRAGEIVFFSGYQEKNSYFDMWYMCQTAHTGGCTAANIAEGMMRYPMTTIYQSPHQEADAAYDADDDVYYLFGGDTDGYSLWVFCKTFGASAPNGVGEKSCNASNVGGWVKVTSRNNPNPGPHDGHAMTYDTTNHFLTVYGGQANVGYTSVGIFSPAADIWCVTDKSQGKNTPTALSESATTVTVTSTLNPPVNSQIMVVGMTPGGYNGRFTVTASSPTSFTYTDSVPGLGPATFIGFVSETDNYLATAPLCGPTTGPQIPPGLTGNRWPAWDFDSTRGVHVFFYGQNATYTFNATNLTWTLTNITGGPKGIPSPTGNSLGYDPIHDVHVFCGVGSGNLGPACWELPGGAIGMVQQSTFTTILSGSVVITGNGVVQ